MPGGAPAGLPDRAGHAQRGRHGERHAGRLRRRGRHRHLQRRPRAGDVYKRQLYTYEQYFAAKDGGDLTLTLDATIQYYLEKGMESMLDKRCV